MSLPLEQTVAIMNAAKAPVSNTRTVLLLTIAIISTIPALIKLFIYIREKKKRRRK